MATVRTMITDGDAPRDLSRLVMPLGGSLEATGDLFEPYRLVDGDGVVLVPAAAYFRELAACGRPAATHRSYGMLCRVRHNIPLMIPLSPLRMRRSLNSPGW